MYVRIFPMSFLSTVHEKDWSSMYTTTTWARRVLHLMRARVNPIRWMAPLYAAVSARRQVGSECLLRGWQVTPSQRYLRPSKDPVYSSQPSPYANHCTTNATSRIYRDDERQFETAIPQI